MPRSPDIETWVYRDRDGTWAYGVSVDGEPAQGGFAQTVEEAHERVDQLRLAFDETGP